MSATKNPSSTTTDDVVTYRRLRFSQAAIDKLTAPPGSRVKYVDVRGTGLVLEVSGPNRRHPKGARKIFKVPLRFGKEQVTITLGQSSPALRLATAEDQCAELKFMRVKGIDPRVGRETSKPAAEPIQKVDTLHATLDRFIDQYLDERNADGSLKLSSGYRADTERYLRAFEAALGATRDVATIKRREIREYLASLLKHRTAANRAHAAISAFFAWCADDEIEILDQSPAVGLRKPGGNESERDRCLDEKVEISICWRAALAMPTPFSQLYRGKGPVRGFALVKANVDRLIAKICQDEERAAIPHWRNHDLRRTAATLMGRLRVTEFDISRVLNHANREGETKTYNLHNYDDVKLIALEKLATRLRVLTGDTPDDNIVNLADRLTA